MEQGPNPTLGNGNAVWQLWARILILSRQKKTIAIGLLTDDITIWHGRTGQDGQDSGEKQPPAKGNLGQDFPTSQGKTPQACCCWTLFMCDTLLLCWAQYCEPSPLTMYGHELYILA